MNKLITVFFLGFLFLGSIAYAQTASSVFSVKVNGQTVFTEYYKTVPDEPNSNNTGIRWPLENVSFCHFTFTGTVTVEVTVVPNFAAFNFSPKRHGKPVTRAGNVLTFTLDKPGKFNINMDNDNTVNEQLFIFADVLEDKPNLSDPNVKNIMSFGANNSGTVDNTTIIQNAINGLSQGQTLFFPAGKYLSKTISLKSNMTLYLEKGATLLGTQNFNDYISAIAFVKVSNCTNTFIKGYGRIDQRGEQMQINYGSNCYSRNILINGNSNNIRVENIFLLDPPRLNVEVSDCSNVNFYNVKALSTQAGHNTDGIDPWNCNNLTIDNSFIYGRDDAVAVKSFQNVNTSNTYNILVTNSIFSSLEGCMKIGTETERDSIYNVVFENNDAIYAGYGASAWSYDKSKIRDIYWRNIGIERLKPSVFANQGIPFYFEVKKRKGSSSPGNMINLVAEKIVSEKRPLVNKNYVAAISSSRKIDGLTFSDFRVNDTLVTASNSNSYFTIGSGVYNLIYTTSSTYPIVSITASQTNITEGQSASFTISRAGSTANSVTVGYEIIGNAKNGIDYSSIASSVTFNVGESQKTITIVSLTDADTENIEQVGISLKGNLNRTYMLGVDYLSVINISDPGYVGGNIVNRSSNVKIPNEIEVNTQKINIYPNPGVSSIFITNVPANKKINFFDINGKLIFSKISTGATLEVKINHLPKGTYLMKYEDFSKQFIVQ